MITCVLCGDRIGDTDMRTPLVKMIRPNGAVEWWDPSILTIDMGATPIERGLAHTPEWIEDMRDRRAAA